MPISPQAGINVTSLQHLIPSPLDSWGREPLSLNAPQTMLLSTEPVKSQLDS